MKNLLIPFDFSDASTNALDYALKFTAGNETAEINLLYISDRDSEGSEENELKQNFEDVVEKHTGAGKPIIKYLFRTGNFTDAVVDVYKSLKIELIIMGTKGEEESESHITKTSKFVLEADVAVLVVPVSYKNFNLDKILFTLGEDVMHDISKLNLLLDVSRSNNARVDVLTVSRTPKNAGYSEADEKNENTLEYFLEMFYSHHSFADNEDILEGIDNYIKKNEVDLLAIMPKTHAKGAKTSKGKLTREVTLKSEIPILILD